ncbi:MAG: hypothetical protein KAT77_03335 [Nanoarchaeota archaeon]|nr:hypothetical protein [Nanoarchaeota archaeon]
MVFKKIKPFEEGWEKLSNEERLNIWLEENKGGMGENFPNYREFLENFCMSCQEANQGDYWNFQRDISLYSFEKDEYLLREGFLAMYNASEALLELKSIKVIDPEMN